MLRFLAQAETVQIPLAWIAIAVSAMGSVIVALWVYSLSLTKKIDGLQKDLLKEKEEKVNVLSELRNMISRRKGSDRRDP